MGQVLACIVMALEKTLTLTLMRMFPVNTVEAVVNVVSVMGGGMNNIGVKIEERKKPYVAIDVYGLTFLLTKEEIKNNKYMVVDSDGEVLLARDKPVLYSNEYRTLRESIKDIGDPEFWFFTDDAVKIAVIEYGGVWTESCILIKKHIRRKRNGAEPRIKPPTDVTLEEGELIWIMRYREYKREYLYSKNKTKQCIKRWLQLLTA